MNAAKPRRKEPTPPLRIAITGSMGMGKSTTAAMFHEHALPLYDADKEVHALYQPGGAAIAPMAHAFPDALDEHHAIDRAKLRDILAKDKGAAATLESIVHPLLAAGRADFLTRNKNAAALVFDIPLLFETGGEQQMDVVVVASAPPAIQRQRLLARGKMDLAMIEQMLGRQMRDEEKRARADFIVETGEGLTQARAQVAEIVQNCLMPKKGA